MTDSERIAILERIVVSAIDDAMRYGFLKFPDDVQALLNDLRKRVAK